MKVEECVVGIRAQRDSLIRVSWGSGLCAIANKLSTMKRAMQQQTSKSRVANFEYFFVG